jgi:hypothetical protein
MFRWGFVGPHPTTISIASAAHDLPWRIGFLTCFDLFSRLVSMTFSPILPGHLIDRCDHVARCSSIVPAIRACADLNRHHAIGLLLGATDSSDEAA